MKSCGVTIAGVIISRCVSTMCMCAVNLQDVFEGLSKNGQRSGVHNFESQGSGYFYGTIKDVHLAILTAVTATPLQVHVSLLELGTCLFGVRCTAARSRVLVYRVAVAATLVLSPAPGDEAKY